MNTTNNEIKSTTEHDQDVIEPRVVHGVTAGGTLGRGEVITTNSMVIEPLGVASLVRMGDFQALLDRDPRLVSHHTKRQYKSDLTNFDAWRNGRRFTKLLVKEYAAHLQSEGYAPNTVNQKLAAIRWYARKLSDVAMDELRDEELAKYAARVALVEDVKGERK